MFRAPILLLISVLGADAAIDVNTPVVLPDATVGIPYSATVTVTGGSPPYTFNNVGSRLPAGLSISTTGVITGTPTRYQQLAFSGSVTVSDAVTNSASQKVTIPVKADPAGLEACGDPGSSSTEFRNGGIKELLGNITLTCVGKGGFADITINVRPNINALSAPQITSKVLDAAARVTEAVAITSAGQVQGTTDPSALNNIIFRNVPMPAGTTTVTFANLRINTQSVSQGSASLQGHIIVAGADTYPMTTDPFVIAIPSSPLRPASIGRASSKNYPGGIPVLPSDGPSFVFRIVEARPTAFKTRGDSSNTSLGSAALRNTETGYFVSYNGRDNVADSGTRYRFEFEKVPAGMRVFVPVSLAATQGNSTGVLTLTSSSTTSLTPVSAVAPDTVNRLPSSPALGEVAITSGTGVAVYEVTTQDPKQFESYDLPAYLLAAGGVTPNDDSILVWTRPAPVGASVNPPSADLAIPAFAPNSGLGIFVSSFPQTAMSITPASLPAGTVSTPYSTKIGVSGGVAPYFFSATGLPTGFSITEEGVIVGSSTTPVSATVVVNVYDSVGALLTATYAFNISAGNLTLCTTADSVPATIRSGGQKELLNRIHVNCAGGGGTTDIEIQSLLATSKVLNTATGASEAFATTDAGVVYGTVKEGSVLFRGVVVPAGNTAVDIVNIRTSNSGQVAPLVAKVVLRGGSGVAANNLQVVVANSSAPLAESTASGITHYSVCSPPSLARGPAFTIDFKENFPPVLKARGGSGNTSPESPFALNTETGTYVVNELNNQADFATRIKLSVQVPSAFASSSRLSVYVPVTLTGKDGKGLLRLTSSETGPFDAVPALPPTLENGLPQAPGLVSLAVPSSGNRVAVAIYEVIAQNPDGIDSFSAPIYVSANGSFVSRDALYAEVSLAPRDSADRIPSFSSTSRGFVGGSLFTPCYISNPMPIVIADVPYSAALSIRGGTGPYLFNSDYAVLPQGFAMSRRGVITGTSKATSGTFSGSVPFSEDGGQPGYVTFLLTFDSPPPSVIFIDPPNLSDARVSLPYASTLRAAGGTPPYQWSLAAGALPEGLTLDPSGTLSGYPLRQGVAAFTVQATDTSRQVARAAAYIEVTGAELLFLSAATMPPGSVGVEYQRQMLLPEAGTAPFAYTISSGKLPPGLSLANGILSGIPTTSGTFDFEVTLVDSAAVSQFQARRFQIPINASPLTGLFLNAPYARFSLVQDQPILPAPQTMAISMYGTKPISYVATPLQLGSVPPWFTASSGTAPGLITITPGEDARLLSPGINSGQFLITCTSDPCRGESQRVNVFLDIVRRPSQLSVQDNILAFTAAAGTQVNSRDVIIRNIGKETLTINAVGCGASWCSVASRLSAVPGGDSAAITVTANPTALTPGIYRTTFEIQSSAGSRTIPLTLVVSAFPTVTLSPSGSQFTMLQGGVPGPSAGSFQVTASAPSSWTASVRPGAAWLTLTSTSGIATAEKAGAVSFTINSNAASLATGTYYGTIRIETPLAFNTAQDFQVMLDVRPTGSTVQLNSRPAGLLFLSKAGAPPPPQQSVSIYPLSLPYSANASQPWLSAISSPTDASVAVASQTLILGVYNGIVSFGFSGSMARPINVTLINAPDACTPTTVVASQMSITDNFEATTGRPALLAYRVTDNCGNPVTNARVVATFNNSDAPSVLYPTDQTTGSYAATWVPRNAATRTVVTIRAAAANLLPALTSFSGSVLPGSAPLVNQGGVVNVFDSQTGAALAPGTIAAIYGTSLASDTVINTQLPLPTTLAGTSVLVDGVNAPLYYVSRGQINFQVPFELDPTRGHQAVISVNGALSPPEPILVAPVTPGLATLTSGTVLAQHADGSLVSPAAPAKPNEYIVGYLAGLGLTDIPIASGAPSPFDPLAHPKITPTLTIGNKPAPIAFIGMTPGLIGLYQLNFQVPADAAVGNLLLTLTQGNAVTNSAILPVR